MVKLHTVFKKLTGVKVNFLWWQYCNESCTVVAFCSVFFIIICFHHYIYDCCIFFIFVIFDLVIDKSSSTVPLRYVMAFTRQRSLLQYSIAVLYHIINANYDVRLFRFFKWVSYTLYSIFTFSRVAILAQGLRVQRGHCPAKALLTTRVRTTSLKDFVRFNTSVE